MRKELNTIIKLEIMFGLKSMIQLRVKTNYMVHIKFKKPELMALWLSLGMKKVMSWRLITLGRFNHTRVNLLFQGQELYIKEKVKLITSSFIKS